MDPGATIGLSLLSSAIYDVFKRALRGNEPEFEGIVTDSIKEAKAQFTEKFEEVEVDDRSFRTLLQAISTSTINPESLTNLGLIGIVRDKLNDKKLLYHPNPDTGLAYCEDFAKSFCHQLHAKILNSNKYRSLLLSAQNSSTDRLLNEIKDRQLEDLQSTSELKETISILTETVEGLRESRQSSITNIIDDLGVADLTEEMDAEIAEELRNLEEIRKSGTFEEGITKSKELLNIIPQSRTSIYLKALHIFLGLHLKGVKKDWEQGITEVKGLSDDYKTPYSKVILAALLNNLRRWEEGLTAIKSIGEAELLAFSKEQRDMSRQVEALLLFQSDKAKDAEKALRLVDNKNNDDYKYISLIIYSKSLEQKHLHVAEEFLSRQESDIRLISGAIGYILDQYAVTQHQLKNQFQATELLEHYLELAFRCALEKADLISKKDNYAHIIFAAVANLAQILGKINEATPAIRKGISLRIDNFDFLFSAGICLLLEMDYRGAADLFKATSFRELASGGKVGFYAHSLDMAGLTTELQELPKKIDDLKLSEIDSCKLKNEVNELVLSPDKYLETTKLGYETFPQADWAFFDYAEALIKVENFALAETVLLEGLKIAKDPLLRKVKIAKFYNFNLKNYPEAIKYYKEILSKRAPLIEKIEYLQCLMNLQDYPTTLKEVDTLDPNAIEPKLQIFKGYSLSQIGQVDLAFKIIKPIVHSDQSDPTILNNYSIICWQKGDVREMAWAIECYLRLEPNDYDMHLNFSKALFALGDHEYAVREARLALAGAPDNELAHFNFINIHRAASEILPANEYISSEDLKELHRDTLHNFNKRFPESKLLVPTNVINYDSEGNIDLSEMKKLLEASEERRKKVDDYYWEQGFPASFMMLALGRTSHEVWSHLVASDFNKGLVVGNNSLETIKNQLTDLSSIEIGILVDPLTLYSLASIKRLDLLTEMPKICIGASTLNELNNIHQILMSSGKEFMTIGISNGQLFREMITEDRLEKLKQFIVGIIEFCNTNLKTVTIPRDRDKDFDIKIKKILDPVYQELTYLSAKEGYNLLVTDWNFIRLVTNEFGGNACGLQSMLIYLAELKAISSLEHSKYICELLFYNYRGFIYFPEGISQFLQEEKNEDRKKALLERVFHGVDFSSTERQVRFLAGVFSQCAKEFSINGELLQLIKVFLGGISPQHKLLFALGLFTNNFSSQEYENLVSSNFESLNLIDQNGKLIDTAYAKNLVAESYKFQLEAEYKKFRQELGLDDNEPNISQ